mmetsp:Transcript_12333/g.37131  ORF Transcript_12333/g.37131 Transcript_12333/m.37131 type:complete len:440 (+) Transcript_12333:287-1606(+)
MDHSSGHSSGSAQRVGPDVVGALKRRSQDGTGLKRRSEDDLCQESSGNPTLMMPRMPQTQLAHHAHSLRPVKVKVEAVHGSAAAVPTSPFHHQQMLQQQEQQRLQSLFVADSPGSPAEQPQRQPNAKRHAHVTRPVGAGPASTGDACGAASTAGVPRRVIANRQSAARSKERRRGYVIGLEQNVKALTAQITEQQEHLHTLAANSTSLGAANQQLSEHASTLEEKLRAHEEEVSALRSECDRLRAVVVQRTGPAASEGPLAAANVTVSAPMQQGSRSGGSGSGGQPSQDSSVVVAGSDDLKIDSAADPISAPQASDVPNDWEMFMNWDKEGGAGGNGGFVPACAAPGDASATITPLHSNSFGSTRTSMSLDVREGSRSTSIDTRFDGRIGEVLFLMIRQQQHFSSEFRAADSTVSCCHTVHGPVGRPRELAIYVHEISH